MIGMPQHRWPSGQMLLKLKEWTKSRKENLMSRIKVEKNEEKEEEIAYHKAKE